MSQRLLQHATEFSWRHWTALGVRGVAPAPASAVDLEALIVFTPWIAKEEPRLAAEVADWCARIGRDFVSLSRLRRLRRAFPTAPTGQPHDLLALLADRAVATRFRGSMKSRRPPLDHPSLVQLRARMIFGVGARADVLARLARIESDDASDDDATFALAAIHPPGYARQSIAVVLDELAASGVLSKTTAERSVGYRLRKAAALRALVAPLPATAPNWVARLFAVALVLDAWRRYGTRATYGVELAAVLAKASKQVRVLKGWPALVGRPVQVVAAVDRWAIGLLDDEAWRAEWLVGGHDIGDAILEGITDEVVQTVHEGDYPVGMVELDDYAYRAIDLAAGTARFRVGFSADHHREDFTFTGHVEGTLSFTPGAQGRDAILDSLEVRSAEAHFDLGDEPAVQ